MASGAQASEEAGFVGGEYEVASSNQLTGETGRVAAGGEIEVASSGNLVAEGTERVGGLFRVSPTNQVTGEAGTVGGEIGAGHGEQVIQEGGVGGEIGVVAAIHVSGVGGLDDEIGVASANQITGGQGGVGGEIGVASVDQIIQELVGVADEIGVASVNQIIQEPEGLGGEIRVGSADHVKGEAGASEGEIRTTSVNHMIKEAGASGGEIRVVSVNHVTEEAEATGGEIEVVSDDQVNGEPARVDGEVEVASADKVNERGVESVKIEMASVDIVSEPGGESGKIESASVNDVNGESGCGGGEVGVASAIQVNGKPEGQIGGIWIASSNQVNGEPGGACGESGVEFANQVNVEPGGAGGESGVASGNQISGQLGGNDNKFGASSVNQMNGQLGGDDNKFGVSSANQLNGEPGCSSGEIRVASASQVNEEPEGDIGLASANQMNGEPGGNIGLASTNQVNRESGEGACEIQVTSANQVNGVSGRAGVVFGLREKHRWVETKVYRRRPKGEKNKGFLSDLTAAPATKTLICNGNGSETNKIIEVNTNKSNQNQNNDHVDGNGVVESEKIVCVPSSADNANLKQIRPKTAGEVISNKELSSAGMDGVTPIPVDPPVTNGAQRPPDSANDRKVKINLASTGKLELRELKRKFEGELYSVRKAVKKMDVGREVVVHEFFHAVVNSSVVPNGSRSNGFATRVYSGTRSLGHVPCKPNIRPFNQLRVSVVENGHSMVDSIEREKRTPKANQFYRNSEFLLANDKFPPAESNKKSKSNGKKSSGSEFGFGVGSKVYKSCSTLLEKLMKHKHGWVFNAPVDVKALGLHDYFLIIKNPMDLGTVKTKLIKYWYKSPMEFAEDVRLTFHNAMLYNPKGHDVHIMAETLLKIFEGKWPDIEVKYLRELRMAVEPDMGYPTPTSRITNPFQSSAFPAPETRVFNRSESMPHPVNPKPRTLTPAPSFRTPALKKPKAKDFNKRDMTYDEKQKLSTNLQSLPPEKLDGVIQIIKKRSTALSQNDDEIEVDIDSVDTETLWELDRFVTNYKKSLSKNRRKAELANQMRAEARQAAEKITTLQPLPQKESTAGYGNATSSLPPHQADPAANASGSSSSSSSSGSGSSSSDSDSDSSSEESDGGHSPGN